MGTSLVALRLLLIVAAVADGLLAQGFGVTSIMEKSIKLHRKLPAVFALTKPQIDVRVSSTAPAAAGLTKTLQTLVETMLQQSDHRVVIDDKKPETLVTCVITAYSQPVILNLTKTVASPSKNPFAKNAPKKQVPYKKVTGEITVSYSAKDARSQKPLDAAVLPVKIDREYQDNGGGGGGPVIPLPWKKKDAGDDAPPAKPEDVNTQMLEGVAKRIAGRIVTTDEMVDVLLARGKLDQAGKLGESGLWPRMLETLEAMTPFDEQKDDAYRLYDLGVAYEAMGYATTDSRQGLKLFERAAINYGKAIDQNPTEKHFREPQTRIQTALEITKTLADREPMLKGQSQPEVSKTEDHPPPKPETVITPTPTHTPSAPTSQATVVDDVLTNEGLIDLKKSGMDDANLIGTIKDSKKFKFDLSVKGLKELMQGGISNAVITVVRQKNSAPPSAARRSTTAHNQ